MNGTKEEFIQRQMMYCQHYDGLATSETGGKCKAGIIYSEAFGGENALFKRMPCIKGNENTKEQQLALCSSWCQRTREQAEKRNNDIEAAIKRMTVIQPMVTEWRNKKPIGKYEIIECPVCKGRLHLSQAACNGHVHGNCETAGCVSWME